MHHYPIMWGLSVLAFLSCGAIGNVLHAPENGLCSSAEDVTALLTYGTLGQTLETCKALCTAAEYAIPYVLMMCDTNILPQDCNADNAMGFMVVRRCAFVAYGSDGTCTDQTFFISYGTFKECEYVKNINGFWVLSAWENKVGTNLYQAGSDTGPGWQVTPIAQTPPFTPVAPAGTCAVAPQFGNGVLGVYACDKLARDSTPVGSTAYFAFNASGGICYDASHSYTHAMCGDTWTTTAPFSIQSAPGRKGISNGACTRPPDSNELMITYSIPENTLEECVKACEEAPPYDPPFIVSHCPTTVPVTECNGFHESNLLGRVVVSKCNWVSLSADGVCTDQSMFVYAQKKDDRAESCKTAMELRGEWVTYNWNSDPALQTVQITGSTIPSLQPITTPPDPPSSWMAPYGMCNDMAIHIASGVLDRHACDKLVRDQTPVGTTAWFSYNRSGGICFNAANKYTAALCGPQWISLNTEWGSIQSAPGNAGPSSAPTTKAPSAGPSSAPTTKAPSAGPSSAPTTKAPSKAPSSAPTTKAPSAGPSSAPTTHAPSKAPSSAPTPSNSNPPVPHPTKSSDKNHHLRNILIIIGVGTVLIGIGIVVDLFICK